MFRPSAEAKTFEDLYLLDDFPFYALGSLGRALYEENSGGFMCYVMDLRKVERWKTGTEPQVSFEGETVQDHISKGLLICHRIFRLYSELSTVVNIPLVADMYTFHDAGEIGADDIAASDPRCLGEEREAFLKQKEQEEIDAFIRDVLPLFDPRLHKSLTELFLSYMERSEHWQSLSAQFAKWIDVVVGNNVALKFFYPHKTEQTEREVGDITIKRFKAQTNIVVNILSKPFPQAENHIRKQALAQFDELVEFHLSEIARYGYEVPSYQRGVGFGR